MLARTGAPAATAPRPKVFPRSTISIARTGLRRDEVVTLADIGALNAFGYDRRSALWQAERAVRPSGELFEEARRGGRRASEQRFSTLEPASPSEACEPPGGPAPRMGPHAK